jgi:hypothetical protein
MWLTLAILATASDALPSTLLSALSSPLRSAALQLETSLLSARAPAHWGLLPNSSTSTYCPDQAAFDWVPLTVANLSASTLTASIHSSGCFATVTATAAFGASGVTVTLVGSGPSALLCSDAFLLTTSFSLSLPVEVSTLASTQHLSFAQWSGPEEAQDVALNGIHVALLPCGIAGSLTSLLNTVDLFFPLSLNASAEIGPLNTHFLSSRRVWSGPSGPGSPLVPYGTVQDLDPSVLRSGDYLAILRFDGLDPLIAFGTSLGGTGHSAVLLWKGSGAARELWVVESTDGPNLVPPIVFFGHGLTATPWAKWVAMARTAEYNVAVLPLAPHLAAVFDEGAAWAWFEPLRGTPYGYQNLLFSVLDTASPFTSLPLPIDEGVLLPVLNAADAVLGPAPPGNASTSLTVDTLLVHGLNKRLNTSCPTFACIIAAANANKAAAAAGGSSALPTSVLQAAAVPESDEWRYQGEVVFVCSGFAAAVYKVALQGALAHYQATEQTPADNVKWGIWDDSFWTAANCPVGLWRPNSSNGTVW